MKRRLFNFLSLLSVLLCAATAGLWVWCYFRLDGLEWSSAMHEQTLPLTTGGDGRFSWIGRCDLGMDRGWMIAVWWDLRYGSYGPAPEADASYAAWHLKHIKANTGETRYILAARGFSSWWNRHGFALHWARLAQPTQSTDDQSVFCLLLVPWWCIVLFTIFF